MAGCTGLEFSKGEIANRAATHANSSFRSQVQQVTRSTAVGRVLRETPQFRRSLGDILETASHDAAAGDRLVPGMPEIKDVAAVRSTAPWVSLAFWARAADRR